MMRLSSLWQRNLVGAVVTAAAIGVFIATDFGSQWSDLRHTAVPELVVQAGQSSAADGRTWALESVKHLNRSPLNFGPPLPPGTVLTVVVLDRSGPAIEGLCTGVITDGERRWDAESIGDFSPIPSEGVTAICNKPGRLQLAFLLPQDVKPTAVDVMVGDQILVRVLL